MGPCTTKLRVYPNDLDLFLHVNNGVYLTLCDLGRVDLLVRSRSYRKAARGRNFLVAAETIQLFRPLVLFQTFYIDTRFIGWDERAFFVEQRFWIRSAKSATGQETVAVALIEGRVQDRVRGKVSPEELFVDLGIALERPELPAWVERWKEDTREMRREVRRGG